MENVFTRTRFISFFKLECEEVFSALFFLRKLWLEGGVATRTPLHSFWPKLGCNAKPVLQIRLIVSRNICHCGKH